MLVVRWLLPVLCVKRQMLRSSEVAIDLTRFTGVAVEVVHTFLNNLYLCKGCMSRVERAGRELDTVKVFLNGIEELFNYLKAEVIHVVEETIAETSGKSVITIIIVQIMTCV